VVAAGRTDRIDAVALARRALREGVERLPVADLVRVRTRDPDAVDDRERLVRMRTALINEPTLATARPLAEQTFPKCALVVEEVDQRDRPAPGTAPSGQHAGGCGSPPRLMLVQPALEVIRVNGVIQGVRGLIPRGLEQPAPRAHPKVAGERFGVGHVGVARGHAQQLLVQFDGVEQGRAELLSRAGRQRGDGLAFLGRDRSTPLVTGPSS
jgi:hypothetical protein